jgi:hypothetical protein
VPVYDKRLPSHLQNPEWPDWTIDQAIEHLLAWKPDVEVVSELNAHALNLPLYLAFDGKGWAPLRSATFNVSWKLDRNRKIDFVYPRLSKDAIFTVFSTSVETMWPKPENIQRPRKRGRKEKSETLAFDAEVIRLIHVAGVPDNDTEFADRVLGSLPPNCVDVESARKRVGALLRPLRQEIAQPAKKGSRPGKK